MYILGAFQLKFSFENYKAISHNFLKVCMCVCFEGWGLGGGGGGGGGGRVKIYVLLLN